MKTRPIKFLLMATALFSIALIAACSDDESEPPADDRTGLELTIERAEVLHSIAVEGTGIDQYQTGSKATFLTAINSAKEIYDNENSSQGTVNSADQNLQRAIIAFLGKRVEGLVDGDLIARWTFDEGSGRSLIDVSGNGHDGILTAGHTAAGGGAEPTWTADRHGNTGKALLFARGGHIVVPSSNAFTPSELSVSVWVKIAALTPTYCEQYLGGNCKNGAYNDNYILSQNAWNGYKFQTQEDQYPFFTLQTALPDTYANIAANNNIPIGQWANLVVTVKASEMKFYIDGVNVTKTNGEQNFTGGFLTLADRYDLIIGQERPTDKVDAGINWVLSHFEGSLDELRMYNKVLTQGQVTNIYNSEKPTTPVQ